ncbi:MAG: hypothetical protein J6C77_00220 [Muribaculaceae bacterium]|nr:hypothetical protein [Muribaculaceae bacterium]
MEDNVTPCSAYTPDTQIGWTEITISGVCGIVLGDASAYAANHTDGSDVDYIDVSAFDSHTHQVAVGNYDSLPFDEAFTRVRALNGPGSSFEWHGRIYGTYYASEWKTLTREQRHAFTRQSFSRHNIYTPLSHHQASDLGSDHTVPAPQNAVISTESGNHPNKPDDTIVEKDNTTIVGFEHEIHPDGSVSNYCHMSVKGHDVVLIDADGTDGIFDIAGVDLNGDGHIDEDEQFDISHREISVADYYIDANTSGAEVYVTVNDNTESSIADDIADPREHFAMDADLLDNVLDEIDPAATE